MLLTTETIDTVRNYEDDGQKSVDSAVLGQIKLMCDKN